MTLNFRGEFMPRVTALLVEQSCFMSPDEIAEALDIKRSQARTCCYHLWEIGFAKKGKDAIRTRVVNFCATETLKIEVFKQQQDLLKKQQVAQPNRISKMEGVYTCPELRTNPYRRGSGDAYKIPSLMR